MTRHLLLGTGLLALVIPVLYLYLLLATPGPATAVVAAMPVMPAFVVLGVASSLLGWVAIAAFSFPHSSLRVPETSNNEGGIPIMRRQVRVRWAASANPAA